jgi:hypothetical protein
MSAIHPKASNSPPRSANTTVVIVAVTASVVGFLLLALLYRLLYAFYRRATANPLPPIQPLAHHRALFQEHKSMRPTTSYDSNQHLAAPTMLQSNSSMSQSESLADVVQYPPMDHTPSPSSHRLSLIEAPDTLPVTPNSSHLRNNSPSAHLGRVRPVSMGSIGTRSRQSSRVRLHGVPHSPHSPVQIIMPSPLSTTLSPDNGNAGGSCSLTQERSKRFSLVDAWAPMPVRSVSEQKFGPSLNSSDQESRFSTSSFSGPELSRGRPSVSPSPRASPSSDQLPPVPRIPSIYNSHTPPFDEEIQSRNSSFTSSPSVESHLRPEYPDTPLADTPPGKPPSRTRSFSPYLTRTPN